MKSGHYTGELVLQFVELSATEPPGHSLSLSLKLDVTVTAKPDVRASSASNELALELEPSFLDGGPWCGQGQKDTTQDQGPKDAAPSPQAIVAAPGNEIVITLEQNGPGEATLTDVKIEALRATRSLPASSLDVTPHIDDSTPALTSVGTLDLVVKAAERCIPAGV